MWGGGLEGVRTTRIIPRAIRAMEQGVWDHRIEGMVSQGSRAEGQDPRTARIRGWDSRDTRIKE